MPVRTGTILLAASCMLLTASATWGQTQDTDESKPTADSSAESREDFLQSARWRNLHKTFDEWLSVQKVYTADEVKALKQGLEKRISGMSLADLQDFASDTEDRLKVLMSDDATDARSYLNFFTMEARRRDLAPDGKMANVFDMTVSQLRQELQDFQGRRKSRDAAQSKFMKNQNQLATANIQAQRSQQQASVQAAQRRSAAQFGTAGNASRSPYAPRRREREPYRRNSYYMNPWGGVGIIFGGR